MVKRTIITGGTGLIGRALAANLLEAGHEVVVLTRNPEKTRVPEGVRAERWDAASADGWGELANGAFAIVNLAGENVGGGRWSAKRKQAILDSRLNAGRAVCEAVGRASEKPKLVVQASAVGFYGDAGDKSVIEDSPSGSDCLSGVCRQWEPSTASVEEQGVRRVIARIGVVLSADGGALPKMLPPFRMGLGGRLGSGRQYFPWIHLRDTVRAIRFLMDNDAARGPFNVCSFDPIRNRTLTFALGRVLHRPVILPVPAALLRVVLGEMSEILLTGQRAVPRRMLEMGFRFEFPEITKALRNLLGIPDPVVADDDAVAVEEDSNR